MRIGSRHDKMRAKITMWASLGRPRRNSLSWYVDYPRCKIQVFYRQS